MTLDAQSRQRALAALIGAGLLVAWAGPAAACPPDGSETRAVSALGPGGALSLDDGSELKLMAVLPPSARDLPVPPALWPAETEAKATLDRLVSGRSLRIATEGAFQDRYGRRVAHVLGEDGVWLQSALVDAGQARVAPLPGETQCIKQLYAREAVARAKRSGLWASPAYEIRKATATRTLERLTGTFQIIEGWVADVGASRSEVFLNFGRNWRWDFTAGVDMRRIPERDSIKARLNQLKGRLVRVRGFIERRNGPFVALAHADAIEELPEGSASGR